MLAALAFSCLATTSYAAWLGQQRPTYALGQPDLASRNLWLNYAEGPILGALWNPLSVTGNGEGWVIIADTSNRRVAVHDRWFDPTLNDFDMHPTWTRSFFHPSFNVLGQPGYGFRSDWRKTPDARTLYGPSDVSRAGDWIAVSDSAMHRILLWRLPTIPFAHTLWFPPSEMVLGQPDFNTILPNSTGTNASSLNGPLGLWTDGQRLAVADSFNHRVLLWDRFPVANGQPADRVLGQLDFASRLPNQGRAAPGPDTMSYPSSVFFDGTRLYVAEMLNHRVLIFEGWPSRDGQAADRVWGQPDFVSRAANAGGAASASTLNGPRRVFAHANGGFAHSSGVYVADSGNNRVLVWNDPNAPSFSPAGQVFGQPDMATTSRGVGPNKFWYPAGVYADREYLYIADTANHRILCYYRAGTPPGFNVAISSGDVTVTSAEVFLGGDTAISRSALGPDPAGAFYPYGNQAWIQAGRNSTDGGPVTVSVRYPTAGLSTAGETALRLYRWLPEELRYIDVTPGGPDLFTRTLSVTFELTPKDWPPQPPAGTDPATWQPPRPEDLPGGGYIADTGELPLLVIGLPSIPVEASIKPQPWVVKRRGPGHEPRANKGPFRVKILVPAGYAARDVDSATVTAAGLPVLRNKKGKLRAQAKDKLGAWYGLFDRAAVPIPEGASSIDIPIEGYFKNGQRFHGSATVQLFWPEREWKRLLPGN